MSKGSAGTALSMELRAVNRIVTVESISCSEATMSARSAKEFEEFAQDCVRLAEQADTPELREKLLNLAREWMRAVMPHEDLTVRTGK